MGFIKATRTLVGKEACIKYPHVYKAKHCYVLLLCYCFYVLHLSLAC